MINDDAPLARELDADGLHLSAKRLALTESRPDFILVGASCHCRGDILRARNLGLDYGILSPVKRTLTHVDAPPHGLARFFGVGAGV